MGTNDYTVRRAGASDVTALGQVGAPLMRQHYGVDRQRLMNPGRDTEEGYGGYLDSQLEGDVAAHFVAERGSRVVGYAYATIEPLS
jgi:hypothetical protein